MGFYATDQLKAVLESCQENLIPPSKNRVWNFFTTSETCAGFSESQPVEPHQEKLPTPTTTVSGVRYYGYRQYSPELGRWLNRDPLGDISFRREVKIGVVSVEDLSDDEKAYFGSLQRISKKKYSLLLERLKEASQKETLRSVSYTEHNLYLLLSNSAFNRADYLGLGIFDPSPQVPGCDGFPDFNKCATKCCNQHDDCFVKNGCSAWWSWPMNGSIWGQIFSDCVKCNNVVVGCLAKAAVDPCCK